MKNFDMVLLIKERFIRKGTKDALRVIRQDLLLVNLEYFKMGFYFPETRLIKCIISLHTEFPFIVC